MKVGRGGNKQPGEEIGEQYLEQTDTSWRCSVIIYYLLTAVDLANHSSVNDMHHVPRFISKKK